MVNSFFYYEIFNLRNIPYTYLKPTFPKYSLILYNLLFLFNHRVQIWEKHFLNWFLFYVYKEKFFLLNSSFISKLHSFISSARENSSLPRTFSHWWEDTRNKWKSSKTCTFRFSLQHLCRYMLSTRPLCIVIGQ